MHKSIRQIRKEANLALSGRRGIYILMFTVSMALVSLFGASGFLSLLGTIFATLFQVGMFSFLLKLCCGQKEQAQFNDLFYVFKTQHGEAGKAILLYLLQSLYILPAAIIYIALMFVFVFMEAKAIGDLNALAAVTLPLGFTIFMVVAFVAFFIYSVYIAITYSMVFFVLLDYPSLTTKQIWKRATQILKGNRLRYIGLEFSYVLYYIVPLASLFAGAFLQNPFLIVIGVVATIFCALWVTPSLNCAQALFYLDLVSRYTTSKPVEEVVAPIVAEEIITETEESQQPTE